jgi:hypothetical protein
MKITEDIRKYAAKHGIAEEKALASGMAEEVGRVCGKKELMFTQKPSMQ